MVIASVGSLVEKRADQDLILSPNYCKNPLPFVLLGRSHHKIEDFWHVCTMCS